jgi:chemotaxis protein CheX
MEKKDLKIFSDGISNYFNQFADKEVEISEPSPINDKFTFYDFSAVIGITGIVKGGIYVTAPTAMIDDVIQAMGMGTPDDNLRRDMIGEVANNISGNAGEKIGADFKISVPMIVTGKDHNIQLPLKTPAFSVTCVWKGHKFQLVVGTD